MHKKNPVMMLERLARGMDIQPLKTLVDILKPIILYDRPDWQMRYNQQTPLIRVVDVAVPDSLVPFEFQKKVNGFLESQNSELKAEIKTWLLTWKNNHRRLKPIIDQSPILGEIEILSETLTQIAEIGLEALDFTAGDKNSDGSWVAEKKRFLEKAKPPQADLMFMIIPAIEKLLERPNQ
jgi:hexosaminidase